MQTNITGAPMRVLSSFFIRCLLRLYALPIACVAMIAPSLADAHVKWFSTDALCTMPPLDPMQIITHPDFRILGLISLAAMVLAAWFDVASSTANSAVMRGILCLDRHVHGYVADVLRYAVAIFFVGAVIYFGNQPVFLTPELKTYAVWVPPLQLSIAVFMLFRPTAWLGSIGIAILYGGAIGAYGWFHLLDYPVFLGVAVFIAIDSLYGAARLDVALKVLRLSAGITLMWGGAEKWLYPWWSYNLLDNQMSAARMGFTSHFFMVAAGYVEFCAAFALAFGRTIPQLAALVLLVPFVGAVPAFGMLDAIGHAPIIVVLVILSLTHTRVVSLSEPPLRLMHNLISYPISSMLSALFIIPAYWSLQAVAHGKPGALSNEMVLVATLMMLPLLCWLGSPPFAKHPQVAKLTSLQSIKLESMHNQQGG